MKPNIRIYSLLLLCLTIFLPLSVSAGWDTPTEFISVEGKLCDKDTPTLCLEKVDTKTFGPFKRGKELFGEYGQYMYADKNALYFFPVNDTWRRIVVDHVNITKLVGGYFHDTKNIYYGDLPTTGIKKIGPRIKNTIFLDDHILMYRNSVYYNGTIQKGIRGNKMIQETRKKFKNNPPEYYIYGKNIYFSSGWSFLKIQNPDLPTFQKNEDGSGYTDKNHIYKEIPGPYGYDFEIIKKL